MNPSWMCEKSPVHGLIYDTLHQANGESDPKGYNV